MQRSFGKTTPAVVDGRSKPDGSGGAQLLQSLRSSDVRYATAKKRWPWQSDFCILYRAKLLDQLGNEAQAAIDPIESLLERPLSRTRATTLILSLD